MQARSKDFEWGGVLDLHWQTRALEARVGWCVELFEDSLIRNREADLRSLCMSGGGGDVQTHSSYPPPPLLLNGLSCIIYPSTFCTFQPSSRFVQGTCDHFDCPVNFYAKVFRVSIFSYFSQSPCKRNNYVHVIPSKCPPPFLLQRHSGPRMDPV